MIHVVYGPPCGGKSTFVKQNAKRGDLVVDLDAIASALGFGADHGAAGPVFEAALAARERLIEHALAQKTDAWIIDTNLWQKSRARYENAGAVFHKCDPGEAVCIERSKGRPEGTEDLIREWYRAHDDRPAREKFADFMQAVF